MAWFACLAVAALAGAALAHAYSAPTATSIRYDEADGRFRGRVNSPRQACEARRKVKLMKQSNDGRKVVGRTLTNKNGRWSIRQSNANGVYSAVVVRRETALDGHVHQCQRGASGTVTVDP